MERARKGGEGPCVAQKSADDGRVERGTTRWGVFYIGLFSSAQGGFIKWPKGLGLARRTTLRHFYLRCGRRDVDNEKSTKIMFFYRKKKVQKLKSCKVLNLFFQCGFQSSPEHELLLILIILLIGKRFSIDLLNLYLLIGFLKYIHI